MAIGNLRERGLNRLAPKERPTLKYIHSILRTFTGPFQMADRLSPCLVDRQGERGLA